MPGISRVAPIALVLLALVVAGIVLANRHTPAPEPMPVTGAGASKLLHPKSGGELAQVGAGSFLMGERGGLPDETPHIVSVSAFFMDRYLVTQELYQSVTGLNPSKKKGKSLPAEPVRWTEAIRFCNKCSELDGLTPCYDLQTGACNFNADGYRLPTEAEWEYACRAGSTAKYYFGDNAAALPEYAWCKPQSGGAPHSVGQKQPNAWGLYDMHGNVWQWCNDFYGECCSKDSPDPQRDPRGPAAGKMKVLRGGAWDSTPEKCRAAFRFKEFPAYVDACFGSDSYGFRRVRRESTALNAAPPAQTQRQAVKETQTARNPSAAAPSAAGKIDVTQLKGTIVFVSDRSGALHIWKMQASGKNPTQLTHSASPDADPRFAPNGKELVYTSLHDGFSEIWSMDRGGAGQKFVTKGSQGCWSPDGSTLLFIRDNQTWVRELTTGNERRVTPGNWERCGVPAWSPDGKNLAVASRHLGDIGIFILSLDGKETFQLQTQEPSCTPEWSHDGKRLLCQTVKGHVHQLNLDGRNWEQLTYGADIQHDARYSPDGSMIVFCRAPAADGPWQLCVKQLSSEDDEDFTPITTEHSNLLPDWHASED